MPEVEYDTYRVSISGPGFHVTQAATIDEESGWGNYECASTVIRGALAMAAFGLPWPTQLLADAVSSVVPREMCEISYIHEAEAHFVEAAEQLLAAWHKLGRSQE